MLKNRKYIGLIRGINVGGKHLIKMSELVELLESISLKNVKTYIQSGNFAFESKQIDPHNLSLLISNKIEQLKSFLPATLVFEKETFSNIINTSPFIQHKNNKGFDIKKTHFFFLTHQAKTPNLDLLNKLKIDSEIFEFKESIFYLYAPEGIGRSKVVANIDKALGVKTTARNWNTVQKLLSL